ncbi:hypothetical protein (plasmid) [Metabacillus dongyingensis]|nr:hypothetical protein [Metabacillus dongyingensis]
MVLIVISVIGLIINGLFFALTFIFLYLRNHSPSLRIPKE